MRPLALLLACLLASSLHAREPTPVNDPALERRVDELLSRMTLDEKIGQLNLAPNGPGFSPDHVRRGAVGAVMGFTNPAEIAGLQEAARSSRLGIPLLVGLDVLHGLRTMFPLPLGETASFDPDLARQSAETAAREAAALGLNWTFAPVADVARDPRWGRVIEGSGEDPYLGRVFTRARVQGFRAGGLAATLKHFAGYGAGAGGRDYDEAEISLPTLLDTYLPPFKGGIEAGAASVMSAFHLLNGVPASASHELLTGVLRGRLGFDGFVVSDWTAIQELTQHGVAAGPAEAGVAALKAGVDMDMASGIYGEQLGPAVAAGRLSAEAVTEAARRVLRTKLRIGLFDTSLGPAPGISELPAPSEQARELARRAARDSVVLLRNQGALPLRPDTRTIGLVGPAAGAARALIGPHEALVRFEDGLSLRDALAARAARIGAAVAYAEGCDAECRSEGGFEAAVAVAQAADVVVAAMGEAEWMTGEGGSRAHLTLPGRQPELLRRLVDTGKPVILVLIAGRPIELGPIHDRLAALAMAWFPGTEGAPALADILFGDADPAGKLPISWPRTVGQVPVTYDRRPTGRPNEPGNRFTLRYVDEQLEPLYPFGFGLTYTRFALSGLAIQGGAIETEGTLSVSVTVTNRGDRPGREVVQLYVRKPVAAASRPLRQLKAFAKVALAPGESRTVTLSVPAFNLGYHRPDGSYVVEPGRYLAMVGSSSETELSGAFELVERGEAGRRPASPEGVRR